MGGCSLTQGYALGCRDSIGGVKEVRIAKFNVTGSTGLRAGIVNPPSNYNSVFFGNAFVYSEDFTQSMWQKSNAAVSGTAIGPFGQQNAYKIVASVSGNVVPLIGQSQYVVSGMTYNGSIYAKKGDYDFIEIGLNANSAVLFNLVSGTVAAEIAATGSIESIGNGWYRCSAQYVAQADVNNVISYILRQTASGAQSFTVGSGNFLFGAQHQRLGFSDYEYQGESQYIYNIGDFWAPSWLGYSSGSTDPLGNPANSFYQFQLERATANYLQTKVASSENGTIFYQQELTFIINKLNSDLYNTLKALAQSRLVIFVYDNNNRWWLLGAKNGMLLTAGTAGTGASFSDRNGYELTFTAMENDPVFTWAPVMSQGSIDYTLSIITSNVPAVTPEIIDGVPNGYENTAAATFPPTFPALPEPP